MNTINTKYKDLCLSAMRSKLAYLSFEDIEKLWLNHKEDQKNIIYYIFLNVDKCPIFYHDDTNTAEAFSWIQDKTLHIIFRGTDELPDFKADIELNRTCLFPDEDKKILVHEGFLRYFKSLEKKITEVINNNLDNIDVIHFQGHSLGAGMSTIASYYYGKQFKNKKKILNYTIGSPRVGNKHFVNLYNDFVTENIRIANNKDPITLFPISSLYYHVDNYIYLMNNGEKENIKDMNVLLRLLYLPFQLYYRNLFSHHKCDLYIERLLKLSNWEIELIHLGNKN
jgi:hypothetical protein